MPWQTAACTLGVTATHITGNPYTQPLLPPLQCAAIAALSSTAAVPALLKITTSSLGLTDVVALTLALPPDVAAGVARLAAASATDADSAAKLISMSADVLVTQACATHPKSKELRLAAGRSHMSSHSPHVLV